MVGEWPFGSAGRLVVELRATNAEDFSFSDYRAAINIYTCGDSSTQLAEL